MSKYVEKLKRRLIANKPDGSICGIRRIVGKQETSILITHPKAAKSSGYVQMVLIFLKRPQVRKEKEHAKMWSAEFHGIGDVEELEE